MNSNGKSHVGALSSLVTVGLLLIGFGTAFTQQRAISDYIKLRGYTASGAVAAIATQDSFTSSARKIFYVNHPNINDRASFKTFCPSGEKEQSIVLGCYQSDQAGIFLLNVSDPRLDGVKQVTAAHEMLHAAYDRLSSSQKKSVNYQLEAFYASGLADERIKTTIEAYKKSEPNDVVNEMHSIFGTEVGSLPKGLEQYYQRYFTNRSAVTSLSARYQTEFTSRKQQVATADAQLQELKAQIDTLENGLKAQQASITDKQKQLDALRSSNAEAYNAGIPAYNQLINSYNTQVKQDKLLISQYNALVSKRNAIAVEEDQLVKSLSAETQTINN